MNETEKPSECINDECDGWHPGLINRKVTMPQGQKCQRLFDHISITCGNEAQVGIPSRSLDDFSKCFRYYCEECAADWKAKDEMCSAYFEVSEEMFPESETSWPTELDLSRLMNGEVTIEDLTIERYTEYATWCIEDGEFEEAAKIISRLIDATGGQSPSEKALFHS